MFVFPEVFSSYAKNNLDICIYFYHYSMFWVTHVFQEAVLVSGNITYIFCGWVVSSLFTISQENQDSKKKKGKL